MEQKGKYITVIGAKVRKPSLKVREQLGIVGFGKEKQNDLRTTIAFRSTKLAREFFVQEFGRETPKWIEDHPRLKWESLLFNVR